MGAWLEERTAVMPWLRFAGLPTTGLQRQPARPVIGAATVRRYAGLPAAGDPAPA